MSFSLRRAACLALVLASGCTNDLSDLTRDEARAMGGGGADMGRDLCEEHGWYGDGEYCDEFCPRTDPDCEAACAADADCPPIFCPDGACTQPRCAAGTCSIEGDCVARLRWLQKDAYVSRAGRTQAFWPPHTTMTLTVTCGGAVVREAVMANHGTTPDAVDPSGFPILEEVWSEEVDGSREELLALADAMEGCECATTFLSLESLDASLVEETLGELVAYVQSNLTCPESVGGTDAIVTALSSGDVELVLASASACAWTSGASWEEGLDTALGTVAASSRETLAAYHVCNNDAMLQADLFARFRDGGGVRACDGASSLCAGPTWFYDPAR